MRIKHANLFYDFITANRLQIGLELGFFHGVSSAYLAGAIQDVGSGRLTTIDLERARNLTPNVEAILAMTGLSQFVHIFYEPRCFTWRLMKLLQEGLQESYDFCYIDGGHTWHDTGFGFCLVERLLRPGGWVIFDDLHYTFRSSPSRDAPWVRSMTEEEQTVPQVRRVFELLVETSPFFECFRRLGRFGFARKRRSIWLEGERAHNDMQLDASRAAERAMRDRGYRRRLLESPAKAVSALTGRPAEKYHNLQFQESGRLAPTPDRLDGSTITVFLNDCVTSRLH
jgi:predicted O-methyltransferase YrrM